MRGAFGRFWRRHPLAPVAVVVVLVAALHARYLESPHRSEEVADFAHEAEVTGVVRVRGVVDAVQSPVAASRGELKYRFMLRDPQFEGFDIRAEKGEGIPVVWYTPPPMKYGFPPERGAVFEMEGDVHVRRRLRDLAPRNLGDLVFVSRARDTIVAHAPLAVADGPVERLRMSAARRMSLGLDDYPEERSLMLAMALGYRSDIPRRLTRAFRRAGTIHIFAISGLHVMLIAQALAGIFAWCGVSRRYVVIPVAPMLAFYVFMTGMQPSAMRAAVMSVAYFAAPLFGRRPDPIGAISFAAIALVAADPASVTELGFIMSFAIVTGLALFLPPARELFRRLFRLADCERTLSLLRAAGSPGPIVSRRWLAWVFRQLRVHGRLWFAEMLSVSLVATLVSFPLTSYFFGICSPYALVANMAVVPLAKLAMISSGAGLVMSCAIAWLALPFNLAAAFLTWLMREVSVITVSLPGGTWGVRFRLCHVVIWYCTMLLARYLAVRVLRRDVHGGRDLEAAIEEDA